MEDLELDLEYYHCQQVCVAECDEDVAAGYLVLGEQSNVPGYSNEGVEWSRMEREEEFGA